MLDEAGAFRGFDVVIGNPPYIRQEAFTASKPQFKKRFATFDGKADLYVYFIEQGLDLLAPGGELSYIAPNKWLRAGYGAPLRQWLPQHHTLLEFLDFGDLPVFAEATTYPAIVSVRRAAPTPESRFRAAALPKLPPPVLDLLVENNARPVSQAGLKVEGWNLADDEGQEILTKLKAAGTPLGEYVGGKIYYGIKTGSNVAFVVDAATRKRLIAEDAASAEIIKPFLAGRDVKRYGQPSTNNALILLPSGWTRQQLGWKRNNRGLYTVEPITPNYKSPWEALVANYPAIAAYLLPFKDAAEARADKGNFWWELRSCDYYDEFEKSKLLFPDIANRNQFTFAAVGFHLDTSAFFIPSDDKYLLGVLNSKSVLYFFESISSSIRGGFLRWKKQYVEQIPIPTATPAEQATIAALVTTILAAKAADPSADTRADEAAVDTLVAALYGVALPEVR